MAILAVFRVTGSQNAISAMPHGRGRGEKPVQGHTGAPIFPDRPENPIFLLQTAFALFWCLIGRWWVPAFAFVVYHKNGFRSAETGMF